MDKTIPRRRRMVSGSGEAERGKYYPIIDSEGTIWLIADQPNMADNIYHCTFDPKSQGFAGRTLHFILMDDTEIDLPAPRHTNSQSLKHTTGIDLTDTHLTYVVIAKGRSHNDDYDTIYHDVIYEDEEPTLGQFNRGEHLARELANRLGQTLYCHCESQGGSSDGPVHPGNKDKGEIDGKDLPRNGREVRHKQGEQSLCLG